MKKEKEKEKHNKGAHKKCYVGTTFVIKRVLLLRLIHTYIHIIYISFLSENQSTRTHCFPDFTTTYKAI
jgi:hypothetical protein